MWFEDDSFQYIKAVRRDEVVILSLSHPERRNAMNTEMVLELTRFWETLKSDSECRAIVLQGDPVGLAFCTGPDVQEITIGPCDGYSDLLTDYVSILSPLDCAAMLVSMLTCGKPIVSKIQGPAFGIGASMALIADVVIAEKAAVFCVSPARLGVVDDISTHIWTELLGIHRAKEYLLSRNLLHAEDAANLGLVNACVEYRNLDSHSMGEAKMLAKLPVAAIQVAKSTIARSMIDLIDRGATARSHAGMLIDIDPYIEAALAYLEKCQNGMLTH